ncbi:MAG: SDR family oxidoreductase [Acidobacteria bacterium]|nr:SDR family oxidoreductase [Acidobacteriota bacterium]
MKPIKTVLVTGGAGYVGAVLTPRLLKLGYTVKVLDLCIYGEQVLESVQGHPEFSLIKGDLRDVRLVGDALQGVDAVIHLACISNDPSFELDPQLGKSINYDSFLDLVDLSKANGVHRFIYASSSSVYGIKEEDNVTEDLPLDPLTDYSKYKAMCEDVLMAKREPGFVTLIVRPATVCGYSPRLRLDLSVNILTNHAFHNRVIKVFGGEQMRPNIHIEDMVDFYVDSLRWSDDQIDGKIYNAGYQNFRMKDIARMVKEEVGSDVAVETTPTDDNRSYHVSSDKLRRELGFEARRTIQDAVSDLKAAFEAGLVPDSMTESRYYNIRTMQKIHLT